jgi:putative aldouronate transport system permease protein
MFMQKRNRIRESAASRIFDMANYLLLAGLGIVALLPFLYIVAGSLTTPLYYRLVGVSFDPVNWTLDSYRLLLGHGSRLLQSFKVTGFVTVVGTLLSLSATTALAYGISKKELPGHRFFVWFLFFQMLFGGGLIPFYLVVKSLGLINTVWAMILPGAVSAWYVFIIVRFFEALPSDLEDAARMDGCSELGILWHVILPLSKPVLATIGLFYAVGLWNQWFWATVFITDPNLKPLQLVLRDMLSQLIPIADTATAIEMSKAAQEMPPIEVLRMAAIVVTVLPIVVVYPFLQKYFVKGVMIGAIKG